MSYLFKYILLIALSQLPSCIGKYKETKYLMLNKGWKFSPRDNRKYPEIIYNDSSWDSIEVSSSWQKQGFNHVGFAWYRKKVFIPKTLKGSNIDSLKIYLGTIKDGDQLFINGVIVGENNQVVPPYHKIDSSFTYKAVAGPRNYILSVKDSRIKWGQENVLAVRVFDKGERGGGGLVDEVPSISIIGLKDYIKFNKKAFYKVDSTGAIDTNLVMINLYDKTISGDLNIKGKIIQTNKEVFKINLPISLKSGESRSIPISLPMTINQTQVSLTFKEHKLREMVNDMLIVPFVLVR